MTKGAPFVTVANQPAVSAMDMGFGVVARASTAMNKVSLLLRTFPGHLRPYPSLLQAPRRKNILSGSSTGLRLSHQEASSRASGTRSSSRQVQTNQQFYMLSSP